MDLLRHLRLLMKLNLVQMTPAYSRRTVAYVHESWTKNAKKTTSKLVQQFQQQFHQNIPGPLPPFCLHADPGQDAKTGAKLLIRLRFSATPVGYLSQALGPSDGESVLSDPSLGYLEGVSAVLS